MVKLLACEVMGLGLAPRSGHLDFRDWVSPAPKSRYTRGIWKVMHIDPYNFTQSSEKKDEGISVNVRIWGF